MNTQFNHSWRIHQTYFHTNTTQHFNWMSENNLAKIHIKNFVHLVCIYIVVSVAWWRDYEHFGCDVDLSSKYPALVLNAVEWKNATLQYQRECHTNHLATECMKQKLPYWILFSRYLFSSQEAILYYHPFVLTIYSFTKILLEVILLIL